MSYVLCTELEDNSNVIFLYRVLQNSMSSTYEDEGPLPGFRTEMAIYYICVKVTIPLKTNN